MIMRLFTICSITTISIISLLFMYVGQSSVLSQQAEATPRALYLPIVSGAPETAPEIEPNNTSDKSNGPIKSGITYIGYHNDDSDYYKFHADFAGRITIVLSSSYKEHVQLQLYYQTATIDGRVGEAKTPPYTIIYDGNPGLYFVRVFTDQCCLDSTKSYDLIVSFPQATPTPTPTTTPTETSTPTPIATPTNTPTPTETQSSFANWLICWHGTDGHEVLVAYPLNEARVGIELTMPLVRPWSGVTADLANDSLKMCFSGGVWYGPPDPSVDLPWFPQVSYVRFEENQVLVCWDTPGCKGQQMIMHATKAPASEIVNLLRSPTGAGIQTLGFVQSNPLQTPSSPTSTPTVTSTTTPTTTPKPTSQYGYNFESGNENWTTSEGDFKPITLTTTSQVVYSGMQALQLNPNLRGGDSDVYQHTETVAYFNNAVPEGIGFPGPYNLTGKSMSCWVYLPTGLASSGNPQAYIRFFIKDNMFRNQFSDSVDILSSSVNKWLQLALTVGAGNNMDSGFDSTKINAIGVRIDLHTGSTLNYAGPLYIDHCAIEYP